MIRWTPAEIRYTKLIWFRPLIDWVTLMSSAPHGLVGDKYVLPTGRDDTARLDVIHTVYGAVSENGLEAASIGAAARAVDIGCGSGTVSRWMAAKMGPSGRVDAIDIAREQIDVARSAEAQVEASPIHFQVGSAYEPGLPESAFDVVFCRLVLCHLKEPHKAVEQMATLLRPGGRLVLVDMDLRDLFTMPPSASYTAFLDECVIPYEAKIGVDYSVGLRLLQLAMEAGLKVDHVVTDQPIFRDGPGKHLWEKTFAVGIPRHVAEGVISEERDRELVEGMERHTASPDVWVAVAKMFAVVASKPPAA
jgi:2-polyprenyl-3-methyl-5-hydroxy-6-metoxy-1,4-benzoquinol methylase